MKKYLLSKLLLALFCLIGACFVLFLLVGIYYLPPSGIAIDLTRTGYVYTGRHLSFTEHVVTEEELAVIKKWAKTVKPTYYFGDCFMGVGPNVSLGRRFSFFIHRYPLGEYSHPLFKNRGAVFGMDSDPELTNDVCEIIQKYEQNNK